VQKQLGAIVTALAAVALALGLFAGARPLGSAPPLGPLLDPANGVWAVAGAAELPRDASGTIAGLRARVRVIYDRRGVPHIFAASEEDAYRALGYVVARDRLFQLDVQTLAASGRLTELGGPAALDVDRETRALGLPRSAEKKLAALDTSRSAERAVLAYADGINAYIDAMRPAEIPVEYRLLGRVPERWRPENSMHLLNRMSYTLARQTTEVERLAIASRVGREAAQALIPVDNGIQEPIEPNGLGGPRFDLEPPPPPGRPDVPATSVASSGDPLGVLLAAAGARDRDEVRGSNNWAVSPSRTKNGYALLAGDPHLELTLPSTWYEAHVVVPGALDVYGVTLPGLPFVIIGFNRDIAWTFTNVGADVLDFFQETVDDPVRPTRYRVDGEWRPLELRTEIYRDRSGAEIARDTLYFSHRGPLTRLLGGWHSMRWTALDVTTEASNFERVARATTADEFLDAMSSYRVPAQNMLVADRQGNIAIRSTGFYPTRAGDGRGDLVRDGSLAASDWQGSLPLADYPFSKNPPRGYLSSANQQPADPARRARYLGFDWPAPWRAMRINELLRADSAVTPDAMRRYQLDPRSPRAELFVPAFLEAAERRRAAGRAGETLERAAELLAQWTRRYTPDDQRAVLFEMAMRQLADRTWDELDRVPGDTTTRPRRVATPGATVLLSLLGAPESPWWDSRTTAEVTEGRDDILVASLEAALDAAIRAHGEPEAGGWRWDRVLRARVDHLLGIGAFSRRRLGFQGGPGLLNPGSFEGDHGASWRMVVELGPTVRAWAIYPGGQSGNPVSRRYDDRLDAWLAGRLDSLVVPAAPDSLDPERVLSTLTLHPRR
jgi:penicillin amidase